MSEDKLEVYKAIAHITGELAKEGISKNKTNQQQGFKYRGIDDVYCALSGLLAANNLCILPRIVSKEVVERVNSKGTALFYTTVEAEFDMVSAVDGSSHMVRSYGEAMDSGDKSIGKAMSYAYKAMAFMAFAIPTEGDNDPDATSHTVKPKPAPQPPKSPSQTPAIPEGDKDYMQRVKTALRAIYGDDIQGGLNKVEELTSFVPKGKTEAERVKGIRDLSKITGRRLEILCHSLEKLVPKPPKDAPPPLTDSCPTCGTDHDPSEGCEVCQECGEVKKDGACRNYSCPDAKPYNGDLDV